ncbi:acyl-CoA N-acyltransferase [Limtongia smithiae]|uniref:acyl-CoA N-acyltransferase n=1 Tax=Limtongia smithiae TaxID=1125753 RepID=UPI0034CE0272
MASSIRPEDWAADANKALRISLVNSNGEDTSPPFNPRFTYPIYGPAEAIYGFKDLHIDLKFGAADLAPYVQVSYADKLSDKAALANVIEHGRQQRTEANDEEAEEEEATAEDAIEQDDPAIALLKFLPPSTFRTASAFTTHLATTGSFSPPGLLLSSYTTPSGDLFEIYKSNLRDPLQRIMHERMQIFVLLFIEAGSYIDATDPRWVVYSLYRRRGEVFEFAGFSTVYAYLWYTNAATHDALPLPSPPSSPSPASPSSSDEDFTTLLPHRKRISQFLILPPFQGSHHGARFYNALMHSFTSTPAVREVTVEDPNIAFDDMRDRCDFQRLDAWGVFSDPAFTDAPVNKEWLDFARARTKIMPRQFQRVVEMALLRRLRKSDVRKYKAYRIFVKQRLFKFNKEALKELSLEDRIDRLDETYRGVELDYYRLLHAVPPLDPALDAPETDKWVSFAEWEETQYKLKKGGDTQNAAPSSKRKLDEDASDVLKKSKS